MSHHIAGAQVTSAQFVRHFGEWQDRAVLGPICVTHHGRVRMVAMSACSYVDLASRANEGNAQDKIFDPSLLSHLTEGVIIFSRELKVVDANRIAVDCLALPEAPVGIQANDRNVFEGLPLENYLDRAVYAGEEDSFDSPSPAKPGRWLRFRTFRHGDGAACLIRDITAEIAARRDESKRGALLAALKVHDAIGQARLSARGTFAEVNDALARLVGLLPEALMRMPLTDIITLNRRAAASSHLEDVITGGDARAFDSSILIRMTREQPVRLALAPLRRRDDGEGAAMIITPI